MCLSQTMILNAIHFFAFNHCIPVSAQVKFAQVNAILCFVRVRLIASSWFFALSSVVQNAIFHLPFTIPHSRECVRPPKDSGQSKVTCHRELQIEQQKEVSEERALRTNSLVWLRGQKPPCKQMLMLMLMLFFFHFGATTGLTESDTQRR